MDVTVPVAAFLGVSDDEARDLLDAEAEEIGVELQEADFDPLKHPRGRGGKWTHVLVKLPGKKPMLLRVTHETDKMLHGVEVNKQGDEVVPKGKSPEGEAYTDRMHVIDKSAAEKIEPRVMSKKYAELVHPDAAKGEGTPGEDEPIDVGDDVEKAAKLLAEGKRVTLNQPRQISTLLDRMAEMVAQAKREGSDAPNFDLCKVSVKGTNLFCAQSRGIPRVQMPQFKGMATPGSKADALAKNEKGRVSLDDPWREHLRGLGVKIETGTEKASYLRASQHDLNGANVARIAHEIEAGRKTDPIFVSRDNYILDGHHQWAGKIGAAARGGNVEDVDMPIERIDMPITDLIEEARKFTADYGMAAQAATDRNETVEPQAWADPPPPVGAPGSTRGGGGYSSDAAYGTNTALGHVGEQAFVKIVGGGRVLHPAGKGAQSPLDVHFDGYGFEVKAVSTKTLGYKATPKKHEIEAKEAAAKELGVKAALAIVVIDSDNGMAHGYYRDGLQGGRLSQGRGWKYLGSTKLADPAAAQRAHLDPQIREAAFESRLHPRDRVGRWIRKFGFEPDEARSMIAHMGSGVHVEAHGVHVERTDLGWMVYRESEGGSHADNPEDALSLIDEKMKHAPDPKPLHVLDVFDTSPDRKLPVRGSDGKIVDVVQGTVTPPEHTQAAVVVAAAAIESVHSHDSLLDSDNPPRIGLASWPLYDGEQAHIAQGKDASHVVPLYMVVGSNSTQPEFSFVHEWAHLLDTQVFGNQRGFGSHMAVEDAEHPLREIVELLAETPEIKQIAASLERHDTYTVKVNDEVREASIAEFHDYFRYLLKPHEAFARAYSQWIAQRSGNEKMLKAVREHAEPQLLVKTQWDRDNFLEVADAFDELFGIGTRT